MTSSRLTPQQLEQLIAEKRQKALQLRERKQKEKDAAAQQLLHNTNAFSRMKPYQRPTQPCTPQNVNQRQRQPNPSPTLTPSPSTPVSHQKPITIKIKLIANNRFEVSERQRC